MYPIAIVGGGVTAWAALRACHLAGFEQVSVFHQHRQQPLALAGYTLPACQTKVLHALELTTPLREQGWLPDREQLRFAQSAYLLSELPLGKFSSDRYHTPHLNFEAADLVRLLRGNHPSEAFPGLTQLQREYSLVLITEPLPDEKSDEKPDEMPDEAPASPTRPSGLGPNNASVSTLWHTALPQQTALAHANMTWVANGQVAWQFSTATRTHYYFVGDETRQPTSYSWHPSLTQAASDAQFSGNITIDGTVRQHWYEGRVVFLGNACYQPHVFHRETMCTGLEDAWVLSRMLENYEDEIDDALQQYQRYRRPRVQKIARAGLQQAARLQQTNPGKRLLQHLSVAFSTRFLPEIAMQRIDWLYGYDCIRGFR